MTSPFFNPPSENLQKYLSQVYVCLVRYIHDIAPPLQNFKISLTFFMDYCMRPNKNPFTSNDNFKEV